MKRVILVHRWDGSPDADWYPWLKEELERLDVNVDILKMPHPKHPQIDSWVSHLKKNIKVDEDTFFVGHSVGCQTILRYLAALPPNIRVGGSLFVGGWFTLNLETDEEKEIAGPWITTPLDSNKVKKIGPIVALLSDDDPFVPLENKEIFEKKLGARVVVEHHLGHFNDATAFAVLRELKKLLNLKDKH